MARYQATQQYFIGGKPEQCQLLQPGDPVELPDDATPSRTFAPLDDAARAAWRRLQERWAETRPLIPPPEPPAPLEREKIAEGQGPEILDRPGASRGHRIRGVEVGRDADREV